MLKIFLACFSVFATVNLSDVSFYEILGVSKQASFLEIRQAYKKLAVKFHPDKNPDDTYQEKFLKITEAYETLKDADKRRKYDLYGMYPSYSRKYDYKSQAEYDNLFYNGLYHNDPYVDSLSGKKFYGYLNEGFYFINFYSPFCPPCQNVADHWKKLAEMYNGIVKVGAVNCKYHNSFCYNSMRIGSYPTLLFYPNGKHGSYVYYQGERTLEAMDDFIMMYLRSKVHVPTVYQIRGTDRPIAYVLGDRIDKNALTRIAYQLNGLVTVAVVEDKYVRHKLNMYDYVTVVFKHKETSIDIESSDEKEVLKSIVEQLPKIELIDPEKLKNIRNKLRSGSDDPWVLYFSSKEHDKLELHQMKMSMPDMQFGEIDCDTWSELCSSLQVDNPPAWGVFKRGGAFQAVRKSSIEAAVKAVNLHTLSATELTRILDENADKGVWILLVVPHQLSWDHIADAFTRASMHFIDNGDFSFGITACTAATDHHCRRVAAEPTILIQNGTKRTHYTGGLDAQSIMDYVQLLKDSSDMELTESKVLEILDASSRRHTWLVAHFPANCGLVCDQLAQEWMKVYGKLRPLEFVRVGILKCATSTGGFCTNIRIPTARLYPIAGHHYSVNLQEVTEAPYILEWALERIDDAVVKLNWHSFAKTVIAEELNPAGAVKPWLVYFHSPRCYKCYEMYSDFAIAGILLNNAVHLGKVNCLTERGLCQHEQITTYPSLKLYLNRNHNHRVSSVVSLPLKDYTLLLKEIKPYLNRYNGLGRAGVAAKHDEF